MNDFHDQRMMENLYLWGIPTFFRCPFSEITDADITLIRIPHSTGNGSTKRDQHLGPRALRHISAVQRRVHFDFSLDPWTDAKIINGGDVVCMMPIKDSPNQITVMTAAAIMFEMICLTAKSCQKQASVLRKNAALQNRRSRKHAPKI